MATFTNVSFQSLPTIVVHNIQDLFIGTGKLFHQNFNGLIELRLKGPKRDQVRFSQVNQIIFLSERKYMHCETGTFIDTLRKLVVEWIDNVEHHCEGLSTFHSQIHWCGDDARSSVEMSDSSCEEQHQNPVATLSQLAEQNPCDIKIVSQTLHSLQLKVFQQRNINACGYHAYHNSLLCVRAILTRNREQKLRLIAEMQQRTSFCFSFNRIQNLLRKQVLFLVQQFPGSKCLYPWTLEDVNSDCMERCFMSFVLQNDPILKLFRRKDDKQNHVSFTSIPDLNLSSMLQCYYMPPEITEMDHIFSRFHLQQPSLLPVFDGPVVHVFLIGSENHWYSLVIHKYAAPRECIECIYLDSHNNGVLGKDVNHFQSVVTHCAQKRKNMGQLQKQPDYDRFMRGYMLSLQNIEYTTSLIRDCVTGVKDFATECIDMGIKGLIDSFEKWVERDNNPKVQNLNSKFDRLIFWFTNYYPPQQMVLGIVKYFQHYGVHRASELSRSRLTVWVGNQLNWMIDLYNKDNIMETLENPNTKRLVRRFKHVLMHLRVLLL